MEFYAQILTGMCLPKRLSGKPNFGGSAVQGKITMNGSTNYNKKWLKGRQTVIIKYIQQFYIVSSRFFIFPHVKLPSS